MSDESTPAAEALDLIRVQVDDLIVGRKIEDAIHDARGTFLLAAGAVITPELKRQLRSHDIEEIQLTRSDARRTTLRDRSEPEPDSIEALPETELTRQLDEIVESADMGLREDDSPLRDRQQLRRHEYDDQMRRHLADQHEAVCRGIGDARKAAIQGEPVSTGRLARVATSYLKHLINDADIVLHVAAHSSGEETASDQALKGSLLSMAIGIEMGWGEEDVRDLGIVATVQDWGMALVPQSVRQSPGRLSRHESFELMKHPIYSVDLLGKAQGTPRMTAVVAYQVHERIDGSGYPRGREERMIHPFARVIQVADAYVAMTATRSWRPPMTPYAALECLLRQAKVRQFDGRVVRALLKTVSLFPVGSYVGLSDGSVAQVMRRNGDDYTRPLVKRVQDSKGRDLNESELLDPSDCGLSIAMALPTPGRAESRLDQNLLAGFLRPPYAERRQGVVHAEQ